MDGAPAGVEIEIATCRVMVVTTSIVADLVARVGGDGVGVEALMGSGVDPHLHTLPRATSRAWPRARGPRPLKATIWSESLPLVANRHGSLHDAADQVKRSVSPPEVRAAGRPSSSSPPTSPRPWVVLRVSSFSPARAARLGARQRRRRPG